MIAVPPAFDLDDAASLEAADTRSGELRSAASAGAQVRATAAAVHEGELARLDGVRARSMVIVSGSGRSGRAAAMLVALFAGRAGLPLLMVSVMPTWVGPLDVVLVAGDDAGDPRLTETVDRAVRRGAEVVVAMPDEGPVRAVTAGRATLLRPRVTVLAHNTVARHLSVGLAVLSRIDPHHSGEKIPDLDRLADLLDTEALIGHPRNEVFHNPAKALAARMQGRRVVFAGDNAAANELAGHAADMVLREAGVVGAAVELVDVVSAASQLGAAASIPNYDPLFHDEQFDGPAPDDPVRVFVIGLDADRRGLEQRAALLPDADLITVDIDEPVAGAAIAGDLGEPVRLATLLVRIEMAAAYTKLIGGLDADRAPTLEAGL